MPRPGFVLDVAGSTPPILFHHGESLRLEKLPAGRSRVLYPGEPLEPLDDPEGAIRHALDNPLGDCDPLPALLRPGMRLTIAFDDLSLPLPPMRKPDNRQRVIEAVLEMAAEAGGDQRPSRLRQHQPGLDGRRAQEPRHRADVVPEPPPPPQRPHPPAQPVGD